ncbi:MAG: hypothetical protein ACTHOH_03015 [Lysobacteraceae bacterium]
MRRRTTWAPALPLALLAGGQACVSPGQSQAGEGTSVQDPIDPASAEAIDVDATVEPAAATFGDIAGAADSTDADTGASFPRPVVGGNVRVGWFGSTRDLDDRRDPMQVSTELSLKQSIGDDARLEFKVRALREDAFGGSARTRVDWLQALWFLRTERVDLRIGRQKVRWGKADGLNPGDFFTPIDYTVLLPLEDDRYLSVPAIRADVHLDDTDSLSLVAAKDVAPTRIPWPRPSPVPLRTVDPEGWQLGARWQHTGERLDWSISVFHGSATVPLLSAPAAGATTFVRDHARIDGIGADLARSVGAYGLRAEAACQRPHARDARQTVSTSCRLVAGFDRSFDRWNINLQGVFQYTPGWRDRTVDPDPARRFAATWNAILHGQQRRAQAGMTARIATDWRHETLKAELLVVAYAAPHSAFARPMLTWAANDRLTLRAGCEWYDGGEETLFGALRQNRTGFLEFQLSF